MQDSSSPFPDQEPVGAELTGHCIWDPGAVTKPIQNGDMTPYDRQETLEILNHLAWSAK